MIDTTENRKEIRILNYLSGNLDKQEQQEFQEWLAGDPEAQMLFREQIKHYHRIRWARQWDKINEKEAGELIMYRVRKFRTRQIIAKFTAAAMLIVAAGVGGWYWQQQDFKKQPVEIAAIPLNENVPILTLDNGEQIRIISQNPGRIRSIREVDVRIADSGRLEYIPKTDTLIREIKYHTLTVPHGSEFCLILADGSRVWLNAESSLKYPETFQKGKRVIYLSGEAYFEVKHDEHSPFIINTEVMSTRVLGTSFNIKAYPNDEQVITTLVTGKIAQAYPEIDRKITLTPSHQSLFNRSSGILETRETDVYEALAWREGKIIANNECLENIFRQLARWYNFEVVYAQPALKEVKFYLHSNRYANIRDVLDQLQMTHGIHFTYVENTIYVSQ